MRVVDAVRRLLNALSRRYQSDDPIDRAVGTTGKFIIEGGIGVLGGLVGTVALVLVTQPIPWFSLGTLPGGAWAVAAWLIGKVEQRYWCTLVAGPPGGAD
jgi:hypothetical protein